MRNLVNHELDVVESIKDAIQSREQLLDDRKHLTQQLNNIAKRSRETMAINERDEVKILQYVGLLKYNRNKNERPIFTRELHIKKYRA